MRAQTQLVLQHAVPVAQQMRRVLCAALVGFAHQAMDWPDFCQSARNASSPIGQRMVNQAFQHIGRQSGDIGTINAEARICSGLRTEATSISVSRSG